MQEYKNFEMGFSTSIQKLNKKKKQRKKYQNFSQDSGTIGKEETRNTNPAVKSEVSEKTSPSCMDLKDFPELKVSRNRNQKFSFESNSDSGLTNTQQWLPVVSNRNKKKSNVGFPGLPITENLKKHDEVSTNIKKEVLAEVVSEKNDSGSTSIPTGEGKKLNTNLKEKKTSQKTVQPKRNPNKKKRSDPVFINIQDILAKNKIPNKGKKQNSLGSKLQRRNEKEILSGNFLDSANPKRSRGKHREIKKKKLTNFKMTVIKERILKSKIRENAIASQFSSKSSNLLDSIDFNSEIKIYLKQLHDRKLKNSCIKKPDVEDKKTIVNQEENEESKLLIKKKENVVHKEKQIPQITAEGEIKFSSKFKEYCDNIITPDLNLSVIELIKELIKLQDRLFSRDPVKAKAKKRHVSGIREVRKYLTLKKVKLILIAPNLEKLLMEGSVYDSINELKSMAENQNVPYGFALDRYKLGRCTRKNVAVSAFAVLNYEGLEALFENVLQQLKECKTKFSALKKPKIEENTDDVNSKVLSTLVTAFQEALKLASETPLVED